MKYPNKISSSSFDTWPTKISNSLMNLSTESVCLMVSNLSNTVPLLLPQNRATIASFNLAQDWSLAFSFQNWNQYPALPSILIYANLTFSSSSFTPCKSKNRSALLIQLSGFDPSKMGSSTLFLQLSVLSGRLLHLPFLSSPCLLSFSLTDA
ncbi:hypothetical protein LR48_Vigan03g061100 [Vigna angularis]|uniref:Uncharacterized protein n=1 Tax=Phaseolus angularis TaxID=3914 RepID=A0A0L9U365_PHAAN|nr:hypothetical protein LR48_Vigan03g061100 [Vigna angularis]